MKIVAKWSFALAVFFVCQMAHAWTLPVRGDYRVTNGFWECAVRCYHLGDDIAAAEGAEILSIGNGTVVEITYSADCGNYGGRVLIQYDTRMGPVVALYGHLGRNMDVTVGERVAEGQVIGRAGSRAENGCWPPHLHFGIHRGPYLGAITECDRWTYAGYTASAFEPSNACYCNILDNWYDPSEFLGITPKDLQIVSGSVTPEIGTNETQFTWHLSAETGRGAPITAGVFIFNPAFQREYYFLTPYIHGTARPFQFEYTGRLVSMGQYAYRFQVRTCAGTAEDTVRTNGPLVRAPERPQNPPPPPPPPPPPEPPPPPPSPPPCESHREICNGIDDDCDDRTDEDDRNENISIRCETRCGVGYQLCDLGRWLPCTARQPSEEVCDNRDNDCDGIIDEFLSRPCETACGSGSQQCFWGQWNACSARQPTEERCDYRDNDCDGDIDEGLSCGSPPPPDPPPPPSSPPAPPPDPPPPASPPQPPPDPPPQDPPPPPAPPAENPLPAPILNSPPDGFVREVPQGANWSISISWQYVGGASEYEYEIRNGNSGGIAEQGRTAGSMYMFYRPPAEYGIPFQWKVRAISASGMPGAWSGTRTFMFVQQ